MSSEEPSTTAGAGHRRVAVCLYEDRASEEAALKLAVASVAAKVPSADILVFGRSAAPEFRDWATRFNRVYVRSDDFYPVTGWNVKPHAMLRALGEGYDEAWWLDADVICTGDFVQRYASDAGVEFLVAEEALAADYADNGERSRMWGFEVERHFGFALNSGVMRASAAHRGLLLAWSKLLADERYRTAQRLPWTECPMHMHSDQDSLTALLCARDYSHVSVRVLRSGIDVIQYFGRSGFTCWSRLRSAVFGLPPFVHSQGFKPWRLGWEPHSDRRLARAFLQWVCECSPYNLLAITLEDKVGLWFKWARPKSRLGRFLVACGLNRAPLVGLPLAAVSDVWDAASKVRRTRVPSP